MSVSGIEDLKITLNGLSIESASNCLADTYSIIFSLMPDLQRTVTKFFLVHWMN